MVISEELYWSLFNTYILLNHNISSVPSAVPVWMPLPNLNVWIVSKGISSAPFPSLTKLFLFITFSLLYKMGDEGEGEENH